MASLHWLNNKFGALWRSLGGRSDSIRRRLTILMLIIGLAPTLVIGWVSFITTSNELYAKTVDQLTSTASKQEQKINGLLQQRQEGVTTLTNRFDLQSALGEYLRTNNDTDRSQLGEILQDIKVQSTDTQSITVTNLQGKVLATTVEGQDGTALPAQDYAIPDDKETAVSVRKDARDGVARLYITTKISVNKQQLGVVIVVYRIDDIIAAVQDYTGLGNTGETVVAGKDATGNAVSLFPLRFNTDAALSQNLNSLQLFQENDATKTAVDYRNHEVIVAPKAIGFADWTIATKIDTDEALAPIVQLRGTLITLLALSSIAVFVIALWLTGYFTKPILLLAEIAQRIGKGDLAARINLQRRDEIGLLGENINAMGSSLKDFVTRIESERNRLEVVLNSTIESIVAIDKAGTILIANRAVLGLAQMNRNEIVGKNIQEVFGWTHDLQPVSIDYAAKGVHTFNDLEYIDKAGTTHFVRIIVARVSDEQGSQAPQTIVTIHDETKTRELENMKIDFVSMAAHELRTPLASLRGYIELITYKEGDHINPEISKYLKQALKSSNELGGLINNLLDVTRIERGTLTLSMEKVDIAALAAQAVTDLRFSAEDKDITLGYDGVTSGVTVLADAIAIREVINNLLSNAIKYTKNGGTITVKLTQDKTGVTVRVRDDGIGIPPKALPYLFTKFYRVHGGLDSGSTGTGLGLFISKSIIERHNGTISVQSREGVGSEFIFTLPSTTDEHLTSLSAEKQDQTLIRRHRGWVTKDTTR